MTSHKPFSEIFYIGRLIRASVLQSICVSKIHRQIAFAGMFFCIPCTPHLPVAHRATCGSTSARGALSYLRVEDSFFDFDTLLNSKFEPVSRPEQTTFHILHKAALVWRWTAAKFSPSVGNLDDKSDNPCDKPRRRLHRIRRMLREWSSLDFLAYGYHNVGYFELQGADHG